MLHDDAQLHKVGGFHTHRPPGYLRSHVYGKNPGPKLVNYWEESQVGPGQHFKGLYMCALLIYHIT